MKPQFQFLTGDVNWLEYGGKWHSQKLNNGEFDFWLVLELTNIHDATGEETGDKYYVSLSAVSPNEAGKAQVAKALESCGMEKADNLPDLALVECLHSYGLHAVLVQRSGSNAHKLIREVKREAAMVNGLFGFYMDRPENRIGSTGWEMLRGDFNSALARTIASGSTEGRILAKMHGVA